MALDVESHSSFPSPAESPVSHSSDSPKSARPERGGDPAASEPTSRILILTPTGRDATLASSILRNAGMHGEPCYSATHLISEMKSGAGCVVVSVEALGEDVIHLLERFRRYEPSWSDIPFILLASEQKDAVNYLEALGNVTLLDRPLRVAVFVAAARAALASRHRQYQVRDLLAKVEQTQQQQRFFLSDVLSAVTKGKLRFCDPEEATPLTLEPVWTQSLQELHDVPELRARLRATPLPTTIDPERWENFLVAVGEASTNAIKHGQGGVASLFFWEDRFSLRIEDFGPGITLENLPKATLQGGFSSARTLGMGFTAIVEFVDSVQLTTGVHGTTVTLELQRTPPNDNDYLDLLLANYDDGDD